MTIPRILLTNFHPHRGGGHVTYIQTLLGLGHGGDFRIAVAAPETSEIYKRLKEAAYADLYACDFPGKLQKELPSIIWSISRFRKIVADFKPDIVHTNGGADLAIVLWSHPFGKYRVIRTHHGLKKLGNDFYHRHLYSFRIAENIYVSSLAMSASHNGGLTPRHCVVIQNGVDLNKFRPDFRIQDALKKQVGLTENTFVFGSCAGVGDYKRVDVAITAGARITSSRPFVILAIGDEKEGLRLQRMAAAAGVKEFKYCGFHSDVREFVSLLDVGFVLSDSIETISIAAREMMAMGKPLISSSYGGLRENIIDGQNGILVRPGNVDDVVTAMEQFLAMSPEELGRFSARARSHAEQNFDVELQLRQHDAVYRKLLNSS